MSRPTILEAARRISERPGFEPPTPRWHATLAYMYGLPLSDADVTELAAATKRTPEAIIEHARQTIGRRRFRQLWCRIGRRGRKSATAALIAVYEANWGDHEAHVLPGEQALCAVISKDLAGASVVTKFARLYLDALGIRYSTTRIGAVQLIEIEGSQIAIATLASTSEAPRGFAICCLILDEIAHFATGDEYTDTDRSLLTAAEPAMAQFPDALVVGISTGLGRDGIHYERVERGLGNDDEREILAVTGASWEWSSDITPERAFEIAGGDADTLCTEFEGGVSENESLWMPQPDWLACNPTEAPAAAYLWNQPFMLVDFAEGGGDDLAWGIGVFGDPDPRTHYKRALPPPNSGLHSGIDIGPAVDAQGLPIILPRATRPAFRLFRVGGFEASEIRALGMGGCVAELARIAAQEGCRQIIGDDRGGPYLESMFSVHAASGVRFSYVMLTNLKHEGVLLMRRWARDGQLQIWPPSPKLRQQGLRYQRIVRGARYTYGRPNVKDDYVSLLVTLGVSLIRRATEQASDQITVTGAPLEKYRGGRVETPR